MDAETTSETNGICRIPLPVAGTSTILGLLDVGWDRVTRPNVHCNLVYRIEIFVAGGGQPVR